jgi:hypothetical protein
MALRDLPFTNRNWIILGGGVAVIAAGYGLLSIPPADGFLSLTMAPILLVLGYCVVIPCAILYRDPEARESPAGDGEAG